MPEYFIDNFDDAEKKLRDENEYSIFNPEGNSIKPIIELSSEYDDIQITFNNNITNFNINYIAGFKKYSINNNEEGYLYFNITNELEQKWKNYKIANYKFANILKVDKNFFINFK